MLVLFTRGLQPYFFSLKETILILKAFLLGRKFDFRKKESLSLFESTILS